MSSGLEYKQLILQTMFAVANTGSVVRPANLSKDQKKLEDAARRSWQQNQQFSKHKHGVKRMQAPVHQPMPKGRR